MPLDSLDSQLKRMPTEVLAIYCGDYRFQSALQEFLNGALDLDGNYDLMVIPGGPLSLTLADYLPEFSAATWKWLRFFAELHKIRRLILIQHQDCAFYKSIEAHLHSSSEPRQRQEQDLRRVRDALNKDLPQIIVELYYFSFDSSDRITVNSIL
jgi:hypothetical protein